MFILAIVSIYLIGFSALTLLITKTKSKKILPPFFKISFSYGLGTGLIFLWMQTLSFINIKWSLLTIVFPLMLFSLFILFQKNKFKILKNYIKKFKVTLKNYKFKFSTIFFYTILIGIFALMFYNIISKPVNSWDGWAIWNFKANVFYLNEGIDTNLLTDQRVISSHLDYPLLIPLNFDYIYLFAGHFETLGKIIIFLFSLSIILLFYSFLKGIISKNLAKIATVLLLITPPFLNYSTVAYADIPLTFFFLATIISIYKFFKGKNLFYFYLSFIFASLAASTKNEGLMFLFFVIILYSLYYLNSLRIKINGDTLKDFLKILRHINVRDKFKKYKKYFPVFLVTAFLVLPWQIFIKINNIKSDLNNSKNFQYLIDDTISRKNPIHILNQSEIINSRLPLIIESWINYFFKFIGLYGFIWYLFFILIIYFGIKKSFKTNSVFFSSIIFMFFAYTFIYTITPNNLEWHLNTSMERLLLHLLPLVFVFSFTILNKILNKDEI